MLRTMFTKGFPTSLLGMVLVGQSNAAVTIHCEPRSGTKTVAPGSSFTVDCFVRVEGASQSFKGAQEDFACELSPKAAASGTISSGVVSVDEGRPDILFPGGLHPINTFECTTAHVANIDQFPLVTVNPGETKYLSSIEYQASADCDGQFQFDLEGRSDPPTDSDTTLLLLALRPDGADLIPFGFTPNNYTCSTAPPPTGEIPAVSEWGLVIMTLTLAVGAKVSFSRRRPLRALLR